MLTKSNGRRSLDRCKQLCEAVIYSCLAYSFNLCDFTNGVFSTTEPYVLSEKVSKQKKKKMDLHVCREFSKTEVHKAHPVQRCAATVARGHIFTTRFSVSNLVMPNHSEAWPVVADQSYHIAKSRLICSGSHRRMRKPQRVTLKTNGERTLQCATVERLYTPLDSKQCNHISPQSI